MNFNLKILRAAVIIGALTLLAKFGSAGKEIVVAKWFGRADALDAFLIALLVPTTVMNLLADALSVALVPTYIKVRDTQGKEAAHRLLSSFFILFASILAGVTIVVGLLAPYYLPLFGSGFSASKLELTRYLLSMLLPYGLMNGLFIFWAAILYAYEDFAVPSWSPIFVPLAIVTFVLLAGGAWGIYALAAGSLVGMFLQCVAVMWAIRAKGIIGWPRWYGSSSSLLHVVAQSFPTIPTSALIGGMGFVDQTMAAMLPSGSVAALGYGLKLPGLINGFGSAALAQAILPYFSAMAARQDSEGIVKTLNTYALLCVWVGTAISSFLYLFCRPLIALLFQRGAFTAADTIIVSRISAFYSLEIPAFLLTMLAARVLSSLSLNHLLAVVVLMNFIVNIAMNFLLMKYFGVAGIALSTTTVFIFSTVALFVVLAHRTRIALERGTIVQIFYAGLVLLASVALSELNRSGIAVELVGWSLVLMISIWGLSKRFAYRDILPILARIAHP